MNEKEVNEKNTKIILLDGTVIEAKEEDVIIWSNTLYIEVREAKIYSKELGVFNATNICIPFSSIKFFYPKKP